MNYADEYAFMMQSVLYDIEPSIFFQLFNVSAFLFFNIQGRIFVYPNFISLFETKSIVSRDSLFLFIY